MKLNERISEAYIADAGEKQDGGRVNISVVLIFPPVLFNLCQTIVINQVRLKESSHRIKDRIMCKTGALRGIPARGVGAYLQSK